MKPLGRKGSKGGGGGGAPGDIGNMLKQAQQMQQSLLDVQQQLEEQIVVGTAGGEVVKVEMTGKHEVKAVKLAEEAVDPEDVETLEDLLVAAFNNALEKANEMASEQMSSVTGGMNIPGMNGLF